jgi:serine/threonine protein kinase
MGFHRDIKPHNLLVTKHDDGTLIVKVGDFGVARVPITANSPMTRSAWGTEGYIAPEILRGAEFAAAADVYSLGVTATELLTGSKNRAALQTAQMPPALRGLVTEMIDPMPLRRPGVFDVAKRLQQVLQAPVAPAWPLHPHPWQPTASTGENGAANGLLVMAGLIALAAIISGASENGN